MAPYVIVLCCLVVSLLVCFTSRQQYPTSASDDSNNNISSVSTTPCLPHSTLAAAPPTHLNTTLCTDKCQSDCKSYTTPLNRCYNGQHLFPNDPSWSPFDLLDAVVCQTLVRTIFEASSNSSCQSSNADDHFSIPLDTCVGPFGKPRPWGILEAIVEAESVRIQ